MTGIEYIWMIGAWAVLFLSASWLIAHWRS
jgi:hypothetical protein